jgi:hypothetical protein
LDENLFSDSHSVGQLHVKLIIYDLCVLYGYYAVINTIQVRRSLYPACTSIVGKASELNKIRTIDLVYVVDSVLFINVTDLCGWLVEGLGSSPELLHASEYSTLLYSTLAAEISNNCKS